MPPKLTLPRGWKCRVRSSVLHILTLSRDWFTPFSAGTIFDQDRTLTCWNNGPFTAHLDQYTEPGSCVP